MPDAHRRKLTARDLAARKGGDKIVMLAAYDYPFARLIEAAGVDMLLVGDSLGMIVQGHNSTVPVTMDDIVYHTRAARRGAPDTHITADLPFLSYQVSDAQALENAGRLLQEGGADSVKLEGGMVVRDRIAALVAAGIPVVGHVGLAPQSAAVTGGFKVQGKDVASARRVIADAEAVAEAGAFCLVLELIPAELAAIITSRVGIPTIGIGAGIDCDGQVLVAADVVGLDDRYTFKFVRRYAEVGQTMATAFASFATDVRSGAFPAAEQSYAMKPDVLEGLRRSLDETDATG